MSRRVNGPETFDRAVPSLDSTDAWLKFGDGASALVLFALMAMTCIDVVGRYFFNSPLDGATELTQLMMGLIVFAILPTVCLSLIHI